ncbi:hypothetical protein [Gilliamella apicola]|uniref:hypothetical protein n=1 Tax=Gilliamella apicola TaxID=1196095 RepID=UPI002FEE65A8
MDEFTKSIDTKIIPNNLKDTLIDEYYKETALPKIENPFPNTIIIGRDKNLMPELNPNQFYFGCQILDR